jgi:ribonuclease BN (tRNA processing enzyme)
MRITVLGKSPSWQDAGGACSGYLISDDETTVLLDCGNGVFGKLRQHLDYTELDAVVVSHLHADHFVDLIPYSYALTLSPRQQPVPVAGFPGTDRPARPRLIAPRGAREAFRRIVGTWGDPTLIEDGFELEEFEPDSRPRVGSLSLRFALVPHYVDAFAIEVTSSNGDGRLTYGSDHRPADEIVAFARDTDLLLIEATLPRPERSGIRGHLTAEEAGEHGRRAGARRVILTHLSDELDPDQMVADGSRGFGAPVELAREGAVYEV